MLWRRRRPCGSLLQILRKFREFLLTPPCISKSYSPTGGSWSRDENVKVGLQFIEAYQTVLWFQSSLPISCRGVAVGGTALRCASRGLNRHLSGFGANPSREKLLSSGFMVQILEFFNFFSVFDFGTFLFFAISRLFLDQNWSSIMHFIRMDL